MTIKSQEPTIPGTYIGLIRPLDSKHGRKRFMRLDTLEPRANDTDPFIYRGVVLSEDGTKLGGLVMRYVQPRDRHLHRSLVPSRASAHRGADPGRRAADEG